MCPIRPTLLLKYSAQHGFPLTRKITRQYFITIMKQNGRLSLVRMNKVPVKPKMKRPKLVMHSRVLTYDDLYRKLEEKATEDKERA
ncbi:hypothetical protein ACJMK2_028321 [Sinanodonta woodiana]|uniref:Uncharacterized protein n=1 Tax=Sinanodonta woodiana TaxID=1069815 RepID=A0ABD3XAL2_SINWO